MTCDHCDELRDRIAYLESKLGLRISLDEVAALNRGFALTGSEARVVLALYKANGRTVTVPQLEDALYGEEPVREREPTIVTVFLCKARKKLPGGFIRNEWGKGYWMPDQGRAQIAALLSPIHETQERAA